MIEEIIQAMGQECLALVQDPEFNGQYVLRTDYKDTGEITYQFPLLILWVLDAPTPEIYCGGAIREEWNFLLCVYFYNPNQYGEDETGLSESMAKPVDLVRRHFASPNRLFLTDYMTNILERYNFKLTYTGTHKAPPLRYGDGLTKGYALAFTSVALDFEPGQTGISPYPIQSVVQLPFPDTGD